VTSIYFQRIFVEKNYSYKFTWFITNNRELGDFGKNHKCILKTLLVKV